MVFHAALARALADNGVRTMFGLIGDGNLFMVDSFVRDTGGTFVPAAGEGGAAVMALGYAAVSGQLGVATVTHGPALSNTITGLIEGVKGQLPMLLVCGDTAAENRHGAQNIAQRELILAAGAGFEQVRSPATVAEDVATAIRTALLERRPVALNVPVDFTWAEVPYRKHPATLPEQRGFVPAGKDIDEGVGIIAASKRPVIIAGREAVDAGARAAILRLSERIGAPVGTTLKAKGLFDGTPGDLGIIGTLSSPDTVETILAADCLIAFGASLNRFTTSEGAFTRGKRIVQSNARAIDIGRHIAPDAALVGDAELVADLIVHWLDEAEVGRSGFLDALARDRAASDGDGEGAPATALDLRSVMRRVDAVMPADRLLVTDCGRFVMAPWQLIRVNDPRAFVYTLHFGAVGLGLPYAIGAAFAAPDRPILLVTGDGGWMLGGMAEFNTAVRHELDLVVVVCNDGSYGAEHVQFRRKGLDPSLSLFSWPDFAPVAAALGGTGITVAAPADLAAMDAAIAARRGPLLIDLKLDPDAL